MKWVVTWVICQVGYGVLTRRLKKGLTLLKQLMWFNAFAVFCELTQRQVLESLSFQSQFSMFKDHLYQSKNNLLFIFKLDYPTWIIHFYKQPVLLTLIFSKITPDFSITLCQFTKQLILYLQLKISTTHLTLRSQYGRYDDDDVFSRRIQ